MRHLGGYRLSCLHYAYMLFDEITHGLRLSGIVPGEAVDVLHVRPVGDDALLVTYRGVAGGLAERVVLRSEAETLVPAETSRAWALTADGDLFKTGMEAHRIRLAHLFDPMMAVHTSDVIPLPHQITAVYEAMLPRQPLRFILADDPGAGKTIMAGLLVRELILRGDADRVLIVAPGSLVEQWQDELKRKFDLDFALFHKGLAQVTNGNPFDAHPHMIARLDGLSRSEELRAHLRESEWDLVIVDEAHKMSASYAGRELKKTDRYTLGELLGERTRHLLLMTATPHRGKRDDYEAFLALLDGDRFAGRAGADDPDTTDLMRRLVKEELVTFEGTPLFPERVAETVRYTLSDEEQALYEAVTEYVRDGMNAADRLSGKAKNIVGFALTILQRRLASSPEAIYQSLQRRRKRLETRLADETLRHAEGDLAPPTSDVDVSDYDDADGEMTAAERERTEEVFDAATSARTLAELQKEVLTLRSLEAQADAVRASGEDCKWAELSGLLQDNPEMTRGGSRRKLIVFTEHRDTLNYLAGRLRGLLGDPEAVAIIHGGTDRQARLRIQEDFRSNPDVVILLATDAAGEGVNLQVAHLMVNYDLPWNPNRLEQRFGRIHRIGQTEVCRLWNMVAAGTREGDVFGRLFAKLEIEREALGGKVFDILGRVFEDRSLRDVLLDAVRYGDDPEVRARLHRRVDAALDHSHIEELLRERALSRDVLPPEELYRIRAEMDRAEARRLQPRYLRAFVERALALYGGKLAPREAGRFEVRHVPSALRETLPARPGRPPVVSKYERVTFERDRIRVDGRPQADLLHPGHPLMAALITRTLADYAGALREGTILVDDLDPETTPRVLFALDHAVEEAADRGRTASRRLQLVETSEAGVARSAGAATYLDYRAATPDEAALVGPLRAAPWLQADALEGLAVGYAMGHLVPDHLTDTRAQREGWTARALEAVHARLVREINRQYDVLEKTRQAVAAGKQPAVQVVNRERVVADLEERLKRRTETLERQRHLVAGVPAVVGVALVVPRGWLDAQVGRGETSADAAARRRVELLAMQAVADAEEALGFEPRDVSADKVGWDIESRRPDGSLRLIEVKGRRADAKTVTVTRNEVLQGLNKADSFFLAVALVDGGAVVGLHYVPSPFTTEPDADVTSLNYDLKSLLSRAVRPGQTL